MSAQEDDVGFKGQRQGKIQNPKHIGLMGISPKWSFSGKHVRNALRQNGGFAAFDWKVVKNVCTILCGLQSPNLTYSCVVESSKHFEKKEIRGLSLPRIVKKARRRRPRTLPIFVSVGRFEKTTFEML